VFLPVHLLTLIHARKSVENPFYWPHHRIQPRPLTPEHPSHECAQRLGGEKNHHQQKENLEPPVCRHQNFSGRNIAYTRYTSNPAQMISMMIGSAFICASTHPLAETHVRERNHKE